MRASQMILHDKIKQVTNIINDFSREEVIWLNGYLSALMSGDQVENTALKVDVTVSIIYISETGNAKFLSEGLSKFLKEKGVKVKIKSSQTYRLSDIDKEKNLILISSTHGEGEIPDSGKDLVAHLHTKKNLDNINFAIIALGDSSYPLFCQSGKDLSKLLKGAQAKELVEPILLDLDFEDHLANINDQMFNIFANKGSEIAALPKLSSHKTEIIGEVVSNIDLNDIGSSKETRHIEIICDEDLSYTPGDCVSILFSGDELGVEGDITPRQYSIASAVSFHGNEVHLTVAVVKYVDENGEEKEGLFSSHLAKLEEGQKIKFKISPNRNFSLPKDDNANIIMLCAGTGIAPFRSFLSQRSANNVPSKSWLFFGERNFQTDFLYQSELQEFLSDGSLTKIDVAFSRDQEEKIYIQNKIKERATELFSWLENGAYLYLCGDKNNMAKDVENTLLEVIKTNSDKDPTQYLQNLINEGRYLKDIY